ncbi:hypothetical protein ACLOJK_014606 [Asimina triloba]
MEGVCKLRGPLIVSSAGLLASFYDLGGLPWDLSANLIRWVRGSGRWYLMQVIDEDSVFSPAAKLALYLDQDAFDSVLLMDGLMLANLMLGSAPIDLGVPSDRMDAVDDDADCC